MLWGALTLSLIGMAVHRLSKTMACAMGHGSVVTPVSITRWMATSTGMQER